MRSQRAAWWFVAPALIVLGVFFFLPVLAALAMSLTDFDLYALNDFGDLRWIGFENYSRLLREPLFWKAPKEWVRSAHRRVAMPPVRAVTPVLFMCIISDLLSRLQTRRVTLARVHSPRQAFSQIRAPTGVSRVVRRCFAAGRVPSGSLVGARQTIGCPRPGRA